MRARLLGLISAASLVGACAGLTGLGEYVIEPTDAGAASFDVEVPPPPSSTDASAAERDVIVTDDFEAPALDSRWRRLTVGGGAIALDTLGPHLGARGLRASVASHDAGVRATAQLRGRVGPGVRGTWKTWLWLDDALATGPTTLLAVALLRGGAEHASIAFELTGSGLKLYVVEGALVRDGTTRAAPPVKRWVEVTLAFDFASGRVEVLLDGAPTEPPLREEGFAFVVGDDEIDLHIGLNSDKAVLATTAWFDDTRLER